jgi:hypothetical protein
LLALRSLSRVPFQILIEKELTIQQLMDQKCPPYDTFLQPKIELNWKKKEGQKTKLVKMRLNFNIRYSNNASKHQSKHAINDPS